MLGRVVSKGIGIGYVHRIESYEAIGSIKTDDVEKDMALMKKSHQATKLEIQSLAVKTREEIGDEEAAIFEAHLMMLDDPTLMVQVEEKINEESLTAASAIEAVLDAMKAMFENMDNDYMKQRGVDMLDIKKRWIKNTLDKPSDVLIDRPVILVAEDITPSDLLQIDQEMIVGLMMAKGGTTSHSAILAQAMDIPCVVGCGKVIVDEGQLIVLDANKNILLTDFSEETLNSYREAVRKEKAEKEALKGLLKLETVTKDGQTVELAANIAGPQDIIQTVEYGAEGIGLFRTEFIYMNRNTAPSEEEQYSIYKKVLEGMNHLPVIIRTMDIGGDKKVPYLSMPEEENPFLGYRAIRYCLNEIDFFKTQLRAIFRASQYGQVKIMFPMISSISEFLDAKKIVDEVRKGLIEEGIDVAEVPLGIMIEIPLAAIMTEQFCDHVDFFSIGTNDLTQYTLAVDRQNEKISELYNYYHPAVLSLIRHVIITAKKHDKWVGMCGSAAGDPDLIPYLMAWGIDELSMASTQLLKAKAKIRGMKVSDYIEKAEKIHTLETLEKVKENLL